MDKLRRAELFLLDMDGTLYLGDEVLPGAREFLRGLAETGRRYVYLTNNSSRAAEDYVSRLRALGFPCAREDVFTSGMATAMYLNDRFPGAGVYALGTAAFRRELESMGVRLTEERPAAVAAGFDTELTYEKLDRAVGFLRGGAEFIAANPDLVCPMPAGRVLPDCGSICALLTAASGREPLYIGKPDRRVVDIIAKRAGVPNGRVAVVGDRLYTDMAAARNAGAVSVLVLSGETTRGMFDASPVKPDYVFEDAAELSLYLNLAAGR